MPDFWTLDDMGSSSATTHNCSDPEQLNLSLLLFVKLLLPERFWEVPCLSPKQHTWCTKMFKVKMSDHRVIHLWHYCPQLKSCQGWKLLM